MQNQDFHSIVRQLADSVDDFVDARWRTARKKFGIEGVPSIQPYVGFSNDKLAWMHGRVLTNPPKAMPSQDDSWWDNLANMYQRFESDEVPGVEVEIDFGGQRHHVVTDEEGYFHLETARIPKVHNDLRWQSIAMRIVNHASIDADQSTVISKMLSPPSTAKVGVISDIDDTVLHTGVTGILTVARLTFLHNARTRKPLPGVGALYRAIESGGEGSQSQNNPIFYISSSPWNLFDLLEDFLDLNAIPAGPIMLRDLGFDENKFIEQGHDHKLKKAIRVMDAYPDLPFVLFGDSGQQDAELYARAATMKPDQIKAIFIRDVDPADRTQRDSKVEDSIKIAQASGVPMLLIGESGAAADLLHQMDFVSDRWLEKVKQATKKDLAVKT